MAIKGPGCKVIVQGRAGLLYKEGQKTVEIDSEMMAGPGLDFVVYVRSIRSWKGSDEVFNREEVERIVANVKEAFRKNGIKAEFEE